MPATVAVATRAVPASSCTDSGCTSRYGDSAMTVFPSEAEIREPLLAFLQDVLGPCRYAEPPTPMTPGNDTQVHAFRLEGLDGMDEPLVLRVFRRSSDPRRPVFEATLQNALADQGLPVPRARAFCSDPNVIGAPFFLMERSPGVPLYGDAIGTDEDGVPTADWRRMLRQGGDMLFDMPRLLAEVCLRVHAAEAKPVVSALEAAGLPWEEITVDGRLARLADLVEEYGLEGLRPAVAWLRESRPAPGSDLVVCHCDMQPLNLMMEAGELRSILDWANATLGPPELEVGWTRGTYLTLALPLPGPVRLLERPIAGILAGRFTRVYERARPIDRDAVAYYEALRSLFGLSSLAQQVVRGEPIRDAWNSKAAIGRVVAHVLARTGLDVSIPWPE